MTERETSGRGLTWLAFVLAVLALAAVAGSLYGREVLPDPVAEGLDQDGMRIGLGALGVALFLAALDRGRRLRRLASIVLIERARARALEKRLSEVSALTEVSRSLGGALEEEQVLQAIVRSACELVDCGQAAALLLDADRPILRPRATVGIPERERPPDVPVGNGFLGRVAERQEPQISDDASAVAVPLVAERELLGVLWLSGRDRPFGDEDLRLLTLYADQVALAIANARALTHERLSVSRLSELDRMKSEFVATITHELKTPLTSLLGYSTILRKRADSLPPEQRDEFFAIMHRQGEKILRLIDELLQSSRIESAERLPREPIDITGVVRALSTELGTARGREILVEAPDGPLDLYGDPVSMEHVVTNLLDNALKYSPEDTPVRVRIDEGEAEVRVSVTNDGEGIPAEELPTVFERFQRGRGAAGERGSVGLGLFIARNLVEAHGGRVWAESAPGRGATFTFTLPRRRHDAAHAEAEPEAEPETEPEPEANRTDEPEPEANRTDEPEDDLSEWSALLDRGRGSRPSPDL